MTWWGWILITWALVSLPVGLLVGRVLRGVDRPAQQRPHPATSQSVATLGDVATPRAVRGRLVRG